MVMRLIDSTSAVQRDLFAWGAQTHAAGAVKRVEQDERDREDRREQRRDRYERGMDEGQTDFDTTLTDAMDSVDLHANQLVLPGMEQTLTAPLVPEDFRGRRLDLEA